MKFGTPGWKERYYKEKFSAESRDEIEATRKDVVCSIVLNIFITISPFLCFLNAAILVFCSWCNQLLLSSRGFWYRLKFIVVTFGY